MKPPDNAVVLCMDEKTGIPALEHFLESFIKEYNKRCGPFEWTKGPDKLRRIIELTEQWQSQ